MFEPYRAVFCGGNAIDLENLTINYSRVLKRAAAAAERAGRAEGSWRLVAVTKTVSAEIASALSGLGAKDLGENRVADLLAKVDSLEQNGFQPNWHMIGHLQRNKVKRVVGAVSLIHSVDSLRLAEEIERQAAGRDVVQDVLLEVNVSAEKSKYGLSPDEAPQTAAAAKDMPHVRVLGLMTMAPIVRDAEETRPLFAKLRALGGQIAAEGHFAGEDYHLSMGMTQDFEVAIEEGATLIRVGSALFEGVVD